MFIWFFIELYIVILSWFFFILKGFSHQICLLSARLLESPSLDKNTTGKRELYPDDRSIETFLSGTQKEKLFYVKGPLGLSSMEKLVSQ